MSVSVDTSSLELVNKFSWFLKIMEDPKAYKGLLDQTQKTLDDAKATLGVVQTKEQADAYYQNFKGKVEAWLAEDKVKEDAFNASVTKQTAELADKIAAIDVKNANTDNTLKAAKDQLEKANQFLAEAQASKDAIQKQQQEVDSLRADLEAKQTDLDARLEQVKKMLGV